MKHPVINRSTQQKALETEQRIIKQTASLTILRGRGGYWREQLRGKQQTKRCMKGEWSGQIVQCRLLKCVRCVYLCEWVKSVRHLQGAGSPATGASPSTSNGAGLGRGAHVWEVLGTFDVELPRSIGHLDRLVRLRLLWGAAASRNVLVLKRQQ